MTDIKRMEKPTDLMCEKCGKPLVIKWGKHGSFIACTGYPECTYTRELTVDLPDVDKADLARAGRGRILRELRPAHGAEEGPLRDVSTPAPDIRTAKPPSRSAARRRKPDVPLDEKCPQCGNNLVLKTGRFGEFTACSNYPTCKYVKQKTIGVKCPECSEGEIVERRSETRQDVLRLQPLAGLQFRGVGQAGGGKMSGVRQPVHGGEVAQGRAGAAMSQRGVQAQAAGAAAGGGVAGGPPVGYAGWEAGMGKPEACATGACGAARRDRNRAGR